MISRLSAIAVEKPTESAEDAPLTLGSSARRRCGLDDAIRKAGKGQALQPDVTVTAQRREEYSLTPEEHRFQVSGPLDAVFDARRKGHNTSRVDP